MTRKLSIPEDLLVELEVAATIAHGQPCSVVVITIPLNGDRDGIAMYSKMSPASTDMVLAGVLANRLEQTAAEEFLKAQR